MSYLQPMFDGELAPGIYQLISRAKADSLFGDMTEQGWRGFYIDGDQVTDKASFLQAAATAMEFPGYFGHNWDAFEEMLVDPSWRSAPGLLLLYDDPVTLARRDP
ncbi:MAG: barstar family protein, partial [Caldilineaceae bacterium]|nr:barstar family protein [Caldilineaceae bacterium]